MVRNVVSFPGLFDYDLYLNETAFTVFGIDVQWYGIILTLGIIFAFTYFYFRGKRTEKIKEDDILNLALFTIPIAIVGARITYVLTNLDMYDSFSDMVNIRKGGIAIYGALIFGILTILIYCKIKKIPFFKVIDAAAPGVMLGQIIGRWGNFVNGEAFGYTSNIDSFPWRMTLAKQKLIDGEWTNVSQKLYADGTVTYSSITVHPTFLYESIWNLLGFIIISFIYRKKKFNGQIAFTYIAWYGLGRGFLEFLRTDSCMLFGQKVFVYLGFLCFVLSVFALIFLYNKNKSKHSEIDDYQNKYGIIDENIAPDENEIILEPFDTEDVNDDVDIKEKDLSPEEEKDDGGNS